jgi:hypothetical protein
MPLWPVTWDWASSAADPPRNANKAPISAPIHRENMNNIRKTGVAISVALLCALSLAACGTAKAPTYRGGGNGGAQATTTTTAPTKSSSPVGAADSPTWVAAQYVAIAWSLDPTWPDMNYAYVLERPYLTPAMNAYDVAQAARPALAPVVEKWQQDVQFKAGAYALVSNAWVVTDAGVTATTCVVEVDFLLGTTQDDVEQGTVGSTLTYAFQMQKIGDTWYVASQPQQPQ